MKFGKELVSQMVQEWQTAYMDYGDLKKLLKDLIRFRQGNVKSSSVRSGSLKRGITMYRAFSGLMVDNVPKKSDDEAILVNRSPESESYETLFLRSAEEGGKYDVIFFRRLDDEFNKVLTFYKRKVEEVKEKAGELNKQMDALIALRLMVDKPRFEQNRDHGTNAAAMISSVNGLFPQNGGGQLEIIQEEEMRYESTSGSEVARAANGGNFRPASLHVLNHVKININSDSPISTLRNFIKTSTSDLSFSKNELVKAEEKLRQAFVEFYRQLGLLKSYCFMNTLAFSKILKKYDKITSRSASKTYLDMVDKSYLGASDEVNMLMDKLEATFIKHFANGNHSEGMKFLRPLHKKEKHRTTFFLGLFTGCSIALVAAIVVTVHAGNLLNHEGRQQYMENIFPLYSLFGYIVLHMLVYGANTYLWGRYRVNYSFIFGFKRGTELGFREIFLAASGLSVLALAAVLSNLDMEMDPRTRSFETLTELVPLGLVIVVLLITFCPFDIVFRPSRFFFVQCIWHCICAPFYKVTLSDFFFADQLTSQVQAVRSLQFYICYYGWGDFKRRSNKCLESDVYQVLHIVVAVIPFWWRFLQCLRRLVEEKDPMQGKNGLKYLLTIIALVMRTMYDLRRGTFWKVMAASTSAVTTIYGTYWDIVIDWGLLRKNSVNPWLRDKLLISNKAVYYVAIVVNILLRLVWMQLVLDFNEGRFFHRKAMVAVVACLEILRRGIWNFFRLENEHFNNVGKFRAFKSVPLPFHYQEE